MLGGASSTGGGSCRYPNLLVRVRCGACSCVLNRSQLFALGHVGSRRESARGYLNIPRAEARSWCWCSCPRLQLVPSGVEWEPFPRCVWTPTQIFSLALEQARWATIEAHSTFAASPSRSPVIFQAPKPDQHVRLVVRRHPLAMFTLKGCLDEWNAKTLVDHVLLRPDPGVPAPRPDA